MRIVFAVLILLVGIAAGWDPLFEEPVLMDQTVGGCADPFVADWNDDGLDDLIVGQYAGGRIKWFENTGSAGNPAFASAVVLQADGSNISVGGT
ncbi:MAG: hypothetical protein KAS73_10235 [Candidatus Sabulitectum sp.]|nr:hypothetical protein [Candidatus Sabulitectum sp.]